MKCNDCLMNDCWGGSAMTDSNCEICGKQMTFGSTNVDKLCDECANDNNKCKQCGKLLANKE